MAAKSYPARCVSYYKEDHKCFTFEHFVSNNQVLAVHTYEAGASFLWTSAFQKPSFLFEHIAEFSEVYMKSFAEEALEESAPRVAFTVVPRLQYSVRSI
ncbi:unnamed protein product [Eruca vesicaria subsp. sativa]|uniref:GIL1/IRKI C-terminal domain-containing protein n=1 Tax=Eruca vesicaria subsp. sativa TaxID=29727 RepID=A0ABC8LGB0_ERUVS|nr:unnamed protein product [Eruca vesicaria subsp. sativa]